MNNLLAANMPLIIDVVGIVFILAFTLYGFIKGFGNMFIKTFGTILSLLFAALLCAPVAELLENLFSLVTTVADKLGGVLTKTFGDAVMNTTLQEAADGKLAELGVSGFLAGIINSIIEGAGLPMDTTLNQIICPTFAYYIVMILSAIVLFIIFKILFKIVGKIIKKLHAVAVIAVVDKSLGLLLGLITGIVYLELAIIVMGIVPVEAIQNIYASISSTAIVSIIHDIGIFQLIIKAISSVNVVDFVKDVVGKIK